MISTTPSLDAARRQRGTALSPHSRVFGALAASSAAIVLLTGCAADGPQLHNRPDRELALHDGTNSATISEEAELSDAESPSGYTATEAGSLLQFGQTGQVSTRTNDGKIQFWSVTVAYPSDLSVDSVLLTSATDGIDHFLCYRYDLTYLGSADDPAIDDTELLAPPDKKTSTVSAPVLLPVNSDAETANRVKNDASTVCDVPQDQQTPMLSADLNEGQTYSEAVSSFLYSDRKRGVNPTGIELVMTPASAEGQDPEYLYWF